MSTLDNILADTRQKIDGLRAESAEEAREATAIAEKMAEPDALMQQMGEQEDGLKAQIQRLQGELDRLQQEMAGVARARLAMADERDAHTRKAEAAANAADYYESRTLPDLARLLDAVPPAEALAATGLMPEPPKEVPRDGNGRVIPPPGEVEIVVPACRNCGEELIPDGEHWLHVNDDRSHFPVPDDASPAPGDLPVAAPPVPTAPAGELVATHRPDRTQPDLGAAHPVPNPAALPPAEPGKARHEKPSDGLMSRVTGGFKALLDKPEQAGEQQGDDQ